MQALKNLLGLLLGRRAPRTEGHLHVSGLHADVDVRRDDFGVPYIEAQSEHDAWLALGYCHAQDRAAQLELIVRAVRGTLAAMVGKDGIPVDRLSRRIGFRRSGEAQLREAEPAVIAQIDAYVRGVNAGIAEGPAPHELALLRADATRWESADVQGYSALLCFMLASNWDVELMRLKVLELDGPEALAALDPAYPSHLPVSAEPLFGAGAAADNLAEDLALFADRVGIGGGSNAWAVSPRRTASGRPLLANDMHLMSALPPPTYLAQLRCPELAVAGGSWVGVPAFAPGHNGFAAWGATAAHADNTDLFLERIGPDGRSVQQGDDFVRCEVREETIVVKNGPTIVEHVLITPRGPIIAEACRDGALTEAPLSTAGKRPGARGAISIAATWLAPRRYTGLYRAHTARSFESFRELFRAGSTSTVSAVYADETGTIGWHIGVEVPKRKSGYGLVPQPGWLSSTGWDGIVPFDELPHVKDPDCGFVCTANNKPAREGPYLGADWLDGYRQAAIADQLGRHDRWDVATTSALQRNTTSLPWRELRGVVLAIAPRSTDLELALGLLRSWDGEMSSRSVGASLFAVFCAELCTRIARARAPRAAEWALGKPFTGLIPTTTLSTRRMGHLVRLAVERPDGYVADWDATLADCLAGAVVRLRDTHGPRVEAWRWGKVRPLVMSHAFAAQPPLDLVFNIGPLAGEGDNTTINQGGVDYATPLDRQSWVPLIRSVMDVGRWDECRFAMVAGQSGNPLSVHYADQIAPWRSGEGLVIAWSRERILARTRRTLRLTPPPRAS